MSESSLNHDTLIHDHHRSRLRRGAVLAVASIAQFMVVLDVTIINVALPQMRTALHMFNLRPAVGHQRLRTDLRGLPDAGRPRH